MAESISAQRAFSQSDTFEAGRAKRILFVDDSDIVRDAVCPFLERSGYSVFEAATGAQAVKRARELKPDLIVMDIVMPGINGIEATSLIKSTMPRVPVIAFTMYETLAKSLTPNSPLTWLFPSPMD